MKCVSTSVPSLFWTRKTSLHSWMPVVSGSEPPLQENPDRGSSSCPSQFSSSCRRTNYFQQNVEAGGGFSAEESKSPSLILNMSHHVHLTWIVNAKCSAHFLQHKKLIYLDLKVNVQTDGGTVGKVTTMTMEIIRSVTIYRHKMYLKFGRF